MRRNIFAMLFAAAFVLAGVILPSYGERDKRIEIEYWDINPGPNRSPYMNEMIRQFEERYPEYKIKHVMPPYEQSRQKILVAVKAGKPPDCSEMFAPFVPQFVAMGGLENLEPYIAQWDGRDQIDEAAWAVARGYGSPAYFLPASFGVDILYYRKDWFQEAGLEPPRNWAEFLDAAKKMTDPSKLRYGFGMRGGFGGGGYILHFMTCATGGKIFDEQGNCILNRPEPVEGLQFYADLYLKHHVTPPTAITDGYLEIVSAFYSGVTAMYLHNNGSIGDQMSHLGEGKFDTIRLPESPWGPMTPAVSANGYSVYKGSKVKDAAWKFISFCASHEMDSYWNRTTGGMPTNKLSQQESWFKDNPYNKAVLETMADKEHLAQTLLHLPENAALDDDLFRPEFQKLLMGKQTAQHTADIIAAKLTEYQKNWLSRQANRQAK